MTIKKKVLFLGRLTPPVHGAALMNERYLYSKLLNKNFNIRPIKINDSKSLNEIGKINFKKFLGFFKTCHKLIWELINFSPDLIYFEIAPKGFAFYRDSMFVLLSKLFNKRIVFNFQAKGISKSANGLLSKAYYKFIFRKSKIVLLSWLVYPDAREVIKKEQVSIIQDSIYDELYESEFERIINRRKKNTNPNLLFLSNMIEHKGPLDVLNICNELKKKNIKFTCNFIGPFSDEDFKKRFLKQIEKLNLSESCFYIGAKYGKDRNKFLEKTDYLIFPTTHSEETLGLVMLESLMYGIPILAYDNASIPEMICEEYLGAVVPQGRWDELSKELLRRLKTKEDPRRIRDYFKKVCLFKYSEHKLSKVLSEAIK